MFIQQLALLLIITSVSATLIKYQSIIKTIYKHPYCLYLIVNLEDANQIIQQIETPKIIQKTNKIQQQQEVCEYIHIKIYILEKTDLFQFENFPAFSSIIIHGSNKLLLNDLIERYALQIISIQSSGYIKWINKNQYFINEIIFDEFYNRKDELILKPNMSLSASAFNCFPYFMYNTSTNEYNGLEHYMLQEITKGFTLNYRVHTKSNVTDTWEAVKLDVGSGRTDIGMCSQWLSISLSTKTYSIPYTQNCATFLVPKPTLVSFALFVFLPLNYRVWIAILSVTLLQIIVIHYLAKKYSQLFASFNSRYLSLPDSFEHIYRILIQQSTSYFPPSNQNILRALILIWILTSLLITTGYSAGITSLLTKPRYTKPINTFDDFLQQNLKWGSRNRLYANILLQSEDSTMIGMANSFIYEADDDVKVERLKEGKYAAMIKTISNNFVTDIEFIHKNKELIHLLRVMHECINNYYVVFSLRENSPLKYLFDRKIYQITESGLHKYWFNEIETNNRITYMSNFFNDYTGSNVNEALSLKTIQGIYVFYLCSIVLSMFVFILEILYYKCA